MTNEESGTPRRPSHPGPAARRADYLRRQGSCHQLPADHRTAATAGAPNMLIVLIDDVGFAASSAFGGPCHTPVAERLARQRCQADPVSHHRVVLPTRRALLTGRNHHSVGMGAITEMATSRRATAASRPRKPPVAPKHSVSTAIPPRSSASAMRFRSGRCPGRPVHPVAHGFGIRVLLRLHRRRGQPVLPGPLRGPRPSNHPCTPGRATPHRDLADHATPGCVSRRLAPDKPFFMYSPWRRTPRITCPRSGPTNTAASSTPAGTRCGRTSSPSRRNSASFHRTPRSPHARNRSRPGNRCRMNSSRCWPSRWRSTPASGADRLRGRTGGRRHRRPRRASTTR